ncbi:hypothetical protein MMC28_010047 [Mycoblastus sanguinarius]|nr:hypothetical protein [Mycoblastus sanguinarius]
MGTEQILLPSMMDENHQIHKTTRFIKSIPYHLYTIWVLTYANIAQFIIPEVIFGICGALSGSAITTNSSPNLVAIVCRWPKALIWMWTNTILFDLSNQRQPDSIREDSLNKSWRPIPAGRLTAQQARRFELYAVPVVFCLSSILGATQETPIMYLLLWLYNDLGGSEEHYLVRNLLNAIGHAVLLDNDDDAYPGSAGPRRGSARGEKYRSIVVRGSSG